jgi:hypothetical protein
MSVGRIFTCAEAACRRGGESSYGQSRPAPCVAGAYTRRMDDDPLLKFISPLAGVVLAVLLSVMLSATVAGQIGEDYSTRAWIYTIAVLWVIVGAVVVFMLTHRAETGLLSLKRVLLWTASIWLWPVFALRYLPRLPPKDNGPP